MKLSFTRHKYATKDALVILCIPVVILAFSIIFTSRNTPGDHKSSISSMFFLPTAIFPALARLNDNLLDKRLYVSAPNSTEPVCSGGGRSVGYDHGDILNSSIKCPAQKLLLNNPSNISAWSSTELNSCENGLVSGLLDSPDTFGSADDTNHSPKNGSARVPSSVHVEKPLMCANGSTHPRIPMPDFHENSSATNDSAHFNLPSMQQWETVLTNYSSVQLHNYSSNKGEHVGDELDLALAKTADANKTVILITLNSAWSGNGSMIDLFLQSFHVGEDTEKLLSHLLIVAVDAQAYDRCTKIHPHCYILRTRGIDFSAEKKYMTQDYLKMMWRRLGFLGGILKRGYSFVFTDTDIMWLRNPFPIFSQDADIQIASDVFNGRTEDIRNRPNCGFKFVRSNNKTIGFYDYWYKSRSLFPTKNEQEVLNLLKYRSSFRKRGMKFLFLDSKNFGGFCQRSQFIDETYTMHANCCKGLDAKLADLRTVLREFTVAKTNNSLLQRDGSGVRRARWSRPKACPRSWFGA